MICAFIGFVLQQDDLAGVALPALVGVDEGDPAGQQG